MGQRIRHFANSLTCSYWHHYFQEKLQKSKLGHLILLQHFMGQRIRHFVNCKLPNPFPLTSSQQNLQDKKHFWKIANTITDVMWVKGLYILPENSPTRSHWPQSFEKIANTTYFYGSNAYIFCPKTPQPIFTDPSQHHHLEEKLQKSLTKQYHSCFH